MIDDVRLENITIDEAKIDYSVELEFYENITARKFNFAKVSKSMLYFKLKAKLQRLERDL